MKPSSLMALIVACRSESCQQISSLLVGVQSAAINHAQVMDLNAVRK
jgi:hypothetical protein